MDNQQAPQTIAGFLARVEQSHAAVTALIDSADPAALVRPGAEDWSVKDHLAHLVTWQRGIVALLGGGARWQAMGLPASVDGQPIDQLNEQIHHGNQDHSLDAVRADLAATHTALVAVLQTWSDADLQRPYSDFDPAATGDRAKAPIIMWIAGDSYEHYEEHLPLIAALLG